MRGVRGLYYLCVAELAWYVLNTLLWFVLPRFGLDSIEQWIHITEVIWVLFAIVNLVVIIPFAQGRRGSPAEGIAQLLLILVAVNVLVDLLQAVPALGGPAIIPDLRPLIFVRQLLSMAAEICLWMALVRSSETAPPFAKAFWALFAIGSALALFQSLLSWESYRELLVGPAGIAMRWLRFGCGVGRQICVIFLLRRLMDGAAPALSSAPTSPSQVSATREIVLGSVFLLGGLAVTLLSYSSASGGGRYVIASGAIAFGLVRLIRGLVRVSGG